MSHVNLIKYQQKHGAAAHTVRTVERLERGEHRLREVVGVVFAGEVQTVHLPIVAPLVERRCRLIVLQAL